jgi:aspartyl-tRNA(Asn)/glutamyl-tRNA(Gln) amidotransferase subunit C
LPLKKIGGWNETLSVIFVIMTIDTALVDQLAHLARLRFDAKERDAIRADLEKMVSFVEQLREVDTEGVAPLLHIGDAANVLREDVVEGAVNREDALRNAPVADDSFFKVPKVIRK